MGRRAHHPRRGSLGYSPRKRASSPIPRIKSWVKEEKVRIQGFSGYKAGMTHVVMVDDFPKSPTHGEEISTVATILDAPPLKVCGLRLYGADTHGLKPISEVWANDFSKDLVRAFPVPEKFETRVEDLQAKLDKGVELRAIVHTQPRLSSLNRKAPEIMEYLVGGPLEKGFEYARGLLGKEVKVSDVIEEGEFLDAISITKGKGFQGALKRWGTKHLPRKTRKGRRTVGTLGPWHPSAMMWTVPTSGQMGYHQRTEMNKRVLKIGTDGAEVTPSGGFLSYGLVKGDYIVLKGSIPGPRSRLVRLRPATRPPTKKSEGKPKLTYISLESKQGV